MWDAGSGEHPDEGTIHAWLDGALDELSAGRVEKHVRGCAACSALTAEARGLIAGASRIVSALDDVPAGARPAWAQSEVDGADVAVGAALSTPSAADRSLWRRLRVTPARAAIAATILVALGLTLTHDRIADQSTRVTFPAGHSEPRAGVGGGVVAAAPQAPPAKDEALDSAVARNLAIAQGKPSIEASRQPAIPQAPASPAAPVENGPVAMAEQRVAAGRAAVQAMRDTAGVAADKLRVGSAAGSAAGVGDEAEMQPSARKAMSKVTPEITGAVASVSQGYADAGARTCYALESTQSGATWGDQPLPLTVVVDSGPAVGTRSATLRSAAAGTEVRAAWVRTARDSVVITLERVGMSGTIALGPSAGGRAGTASSGGIASTAVAAAARREADTRARAKSTAPNAAPSPAPAAAPSAPERRVPNTAPLPVTLRPVSCPAP